MVKIKNRNTYDLIYQCLLYAKDSSNSRLITGSKFLYVLGGNGNLYKKMLRENLLAPNLVEKDPTIEHYVTVYRITEKGKQFIETYEKMQELLSS